MTDRPLLARRLFALVAAGAVALIGPACSGGEKARAGHTGESTAARYEDPAGDGGSLPDIRRIDVTSSDDGRLSFRVHFGHLGEHSKVFVDLWLDTDADPETGNTSFQGADGADYILSASLGVKRPPDPFCGQFPSGNGCLGKWAREGWAAGAASTGRVSRIRSGLAISINRSDLGNTEEFNFFVVRGAESPALVDRAPGSGTFNYSLALGGPRPPDSSTAGRHGDKSGGKAKGRPAVLTLAVHDYSDLLTAEYVAAVERLSRGSIRIQVKEGWQFYEIDHERAIISDVRHGDVDLALVGARAWDLVGITSMRAVVAPFLVDSFALQRRVLESPLAGRMLDGVEPLGLVGLALLPGGLRRPLGVSHPFLAPRDYAGTTIGIRPAGVAKATFEALGGHARGFPALPSGLAGLDGAESDVPTIINNRYDLRARALTSNVVLWPRATTVFMNRRAFDALSRGQREVLRTAGREILPSLFARIESDERSSLDSLCRAAHLSLVASSATERVALRKAVQPVYDRLERDPLTRELIAGIRELRTGPAGAVRPLRCITTRRTAPPAALNGLWRIDVTREELMAAGMQREEVERIYGRITLDLDRGRWVARVLKNGRVYDGIYTVEGDTLRLTVSDCVPADCTVGEMTHYTWSLYRDRLSLGRITGRSAWPAFVAKPWIRDR